MRYAQIENGVVTNIVKANADFAAEHGLVEAPANVGPGWAYDGQDFTPPAPEPVPVPQVVSRFQARAALLQAGLLDQVEQAVVAANDPFITLAWAETLEWRRDSPTLNALASGLGLTSGQIDDLFRTAATITA